MKTNQTTIVKLVLSALVLSAFVSCKSSRTISKSKTEATSYSAPPANDMERTVDKYSEKGEIGKQLYIKMGDYAKVLNENLSDVATVSQVGEGIIVTMKKGDYFDVESFMLKKDREHDFLKVVHSLKMIPDTYVQVSGHTDNTGSKAFNDKLSKERAHQVANFMNRFGVEESRLFYEGYGEKIPGFTNKTLTGRDRNRRVDFVIIPSNAMREEVAKNN
ncbi:OmpA family protein [Emticicia sp. CRIBPO]|uniref:OmpA family protein n=1 Tax=Emticicia sp. CRIBPO TaxID=2683258 RepID=UPI001412D3A3|nr:OmpA family protein [Emticicia sp. CRIBPO]NBA84334.1 OmpA family protein [Emticicia sp. CRIBPO]